MRLTLVGSLVATGAVGLGLTAVLGLGTGKARAETTQCTPITSMPTTIDSQGIYCLTSDFNLNLATGAAIYITANNVVIDLNGHKIGNLSAGPGTDAYGIQGPYRQNITIRNGTIRGFFGAVLLGDDPPFTISQGHLVEDIRADQNTAAGIIISGRRNIVRHNQIVATGGTTSYPDSSGFGIITYGKGTRVIDNDVIGVTKVGTGIARGIEFTSTTDDGMAVNNRITDAEIGIYMGPGGTTKYRDNVTTAVATPYSGGTDAGNNH